MKKLSLEERLFISHFGGYTMKNFHNDLEKTEREFNKQFRRTSSMVWVVFIINLLITFAVLGGIGYVVYALLKHFGIF